MNKLVPFAFLLHAPFNLSRFTFVTFLVLLKRLCVGCCIGCVCWENWANMNENNVTCVGWDEGANWWTKTKVPWRVTVETRGQSNERKQMWHDMTGHASVEMMHDWGGPMKENKPLWTLKGKFVMNEKWWRYEHHRFRLLYHYFVSSTFLSRTPWLMTRK